MLVGRTVVIARRSLAPRLVRSRPGDGLPTAQNWANLLDIRTSALGWHNDYDNLQVVVVKGPLPVASAMAGNVCPVASLPCAAQRQARRYRIGIAPTLWASRLATM
jgi:hypothetical protein